MDPEDLPKEGAQSEEVDKPVEKVAPTESEDEKKPAQNADKKEPYVHVRVSRKAMWSWAIVIIIVIIGLVAWKLNLYNRGLDLYNTTSVTLKVKENDTAVLQGVSVTVNGMPYTTDENGKVTISRIVAGTYTAHLTKSGYVTADDAFSIHRGENDIQNFSLSKVATPLYTLKGLVEDYVTAGPLVNVTVAVNNKNIQSDPAGEFSVPSLPAGDYSVSLSKNGFVTKQVTITLKADSTVSTELLVPNGQVVFVSNRDGKRAIYVSNYDGSNQHQLITPANGGEDFAPLVSPNGQWIVFSSTRDGKKTTYGTPAATLYVVSADGKTLKELSTDVAATRVIWSPNSSYIYYEAYSDLAISQYVRHFYTISTATIFDLGTGDNVLFTMAGTGVAYTTTSNDQVTLSTLDLASGTRKNVLSQTASYFQNLSFTNSGTTIDYEAFVSNAIQRFEATLSTGTTAALTSGQTDTRTYYPSPDGKEKAFVETRDGKSDLYMVDASGTEHRLTTSGIAQASPAPH